MFRKDSFGSGFDGRSSGRNVRILHCIYPLRWGSEEPVSGAREFGNRY